jgi:hypothetical protein
MPTKAPKVPAAHWKDIRRNLGPEREARIAQEVADAPRVMLLADLRRARAFTQQTLAQVMEDQQSAISRIEKQTDMYVSTLRRYIEAMGGELEIVARFSDGAVRITQFQEDTAA